MASTVKVGITAEDQGFKQSLTQMASAASTFAKEIGASGKGINSMNGSFRTARKAVMDLSMAYRQLSDEAKNSDFGRALKEQLDQAKTAAAQLLDMKKDISEELKNMASDTAGWDAMKEGLSVVGSSATALIGIFGDVAGESDTAAETIKMMATAQATLNAVITIGNALQKQSALMKGIDILQTKAATAAKQMETKATIGATAAQRVFNAVAKANPYVLLATAVLGVGAALVAFAKDSAKAKKEEEALQKAEEHAKHINDTYADTVVNNSAEMITKWMALEEASKKENLTQEEKNRIYEAAKPIVEALGDEVNNYAELEDWIPKNKERVVNALVARAIAMAQYAIAIEEAKEMIKKFAEQEANVKAAAQYVGETADLDVWMKRGIDEKYLEKVTKQKTRYIGHGPNGVDKIEYDDIVGYKFTDDGLNRMEKHLEAETAKLEKDIKDKIQGRIKSALDNENAATAILGDGSPKNTPKKTPKKTSSKGGKKEEEQKTAVEKLNKELEAEKKKLENINSENDKDGSKKKEVYKTMLDINKQLEKYYDVDDSGFEKLKGILQDELKLVEANSAEWDEIQEKIKNANDRRLLVTLDKGNAGLEESIALLRENRNLVEEGSDEWNEITQHVKDLEGQLAKLNIDHVKGSLGYIQDLISGLEDIKMNVDINTDEGRKRLVELTREIAALTSEQQIIDIYVNTFSFDNFVTQYDALLEKFKDNEDITLIIKTQLADNAKGQITALNEMLSSGLIDFDKFKSQVDDLFKYLEGKDIDTTNITKELVDGISGAMNGQNDLLSLGMIDTSTFVDNIAQMKEQLVDLGVSGEAAMRALNTAGVQALSDLQAQYDEGILDKDKFLEEFEELKQALEDLGLDVKVKPELETGNWEKDLNDAADAVNSLGSAFSSLGQMSDDPTMKIAGIVAQSIANIALGAGKAIAQAGEMGPWGWIAFGAAIMAQMASMIAQIHSATGYAEGGIIKGSTTMGDQVLARVNAGEMILNQRQQSNLFNALDNGIDTGQQGPTVSTVKVSGSDLYIALKNYGKVTKKKTF